MKLKNLFNYIEDKTNIRLSFSEQQTIKNHLERQVGYICTDNFTNIKYWLTIAYTDAQKYRLLKTVENITKKSQIFNKYFDVNLPICYGSFENIYFVLYPYLADVKKLNKDQADFLYNKLTEFYKNEVYSIELNDETIEKILKSMVDERCPSDNDSREIYLKSQELEEYRNILKSYSSIEMIPSHCDVKCQNILSDGSKFYLIGFEFGGIDLPLGFDIYCLNKFVPKFSDNQIKYYDLHELFYKIHHTDNNVSWLRKWNPIVKIDKNNTFVFVRENGKLIKIPIKKFLNSKRFTIDLKNINLSPFAVYKLVSLIKKRYDYKYNVYLLNSPFWFKGLEQTEPDELNFSGLINKDKINYKNFLEYIKNTQAYICYSRILPYVKPYWFRAILAMLICIPIGSLDAVIALSLKPYMDLVMVEKSIQSPWYIPFGIVAFTSLQGMLNYLATYLNTWVGGKITNDLKFALYNKFLTFETAYFDKKKSGDIVYRFNTDADTACNGLLENMKVFLSRLFSSISLVGVLFYNSWQLAIIASVVLGCAFTPIANLRKRVKSVMDQSVTAGSAVITAYNESFAGNKTIISYNLEDRQKLNMKTILNNIFNLKIKMIQKTSWLSPLMHVIVSIGIGVAIGYGSHLIITKQITSGNFVSFITALILLYTPIKNLGNNFNSVQFSFMAIERIFNILDSKPKIVNKVNAVTLNSIQQNIKFEDVFFEYIKNKPVLKNINLTVNKGETVAFVGNSGGGKSTIVSLIPRFYDVTSGSITIDGIDIRDYSLESLRSNIAVVFQDNFLFSGTIRENILLGNESATQEQLQKAVEMAYLSDFIVDLKDGLDTQIGERGIRLSGGQKQRLAIARAFLKDAPIVILDEATSALDNKAEAVVQKAIENLMQDKTVFVIAHRLSTIQNADKIVVINQGEIVETGTHDELLSIENGAYKALYEMQFKHQESENKNGVI